MNVLRSAGLGFPGSKAELCGPPPTLPMSVQETRGCIPFCEQLVVIGLRCDWPRGQSWQQEVGLDSGQPGHSQGKGPIPSGSRNNTKGSREEALRVAAGFPAPWKM